MVLTTTYQYSTKNASDKYVLSIVVFIEPPCSPLTSVPALYSQHVYKLRLLHLVLHQMQLPFIATIFI